MASESSKQRIDIEELMRKSFRDEMPKGCPVSASPWDMIERIGALGTKISRSRLNSFDGLGFVQGEPSDDAKAVAAAVRALPDQQVIAAEDWAQNRAELMSDIIAIVPERMSEIPEIKYASFSPKAMVINCAIMGKAPEWDVGLPTPQRKRTRGVPHVELYRSGGASGWSHAYPRTDRGLLLREGHCPLEWCEPTVGQVAEARAEYAVWHAALVWMVTRLHGALPKYEAHGPSRPAKPWLSENNLERRVLPDVHAGRGFSSVGQMRRASL